jgi:hypothetical protein
MTSCWTVDAFGVEQAPPLFVVGTALPNAEFACICDKMSRRRGA